MENVNSEFVAGFKEVIGSFLKKRREDKMGKSGKSLEDGSNGDDRSSMEELESEYSPSVWIGKAAQRVSQLQAATHILKATHQYAQGSSLYCDPVKLSDHGFPGSHILGAQNFLDVVGNAAALDVYKFLSLEYVRKKLLTLILQESHEVFPILCDDRAQAIEWAKSFADFFSNRKSFSSHSLAKQLYWLVGDDPTEDQEFHLILPLYASSLAHRVYQTINNDLYGENAKEARHARKVGNFSAFEIHEYKNLAAQKIGGTKPQNISQLNSERGGVNYLLASTPPSWNDRKVRPIFGSNSFFDWAGRVPPVKSLVASLKNFLESDPPSNMATRNRRDDLVDQIICEIFQYIFELHSLEPGWSSDRRCRMPVEEKFLVDPGSIIDPGLDWDSRIAHRFANWLNHELGGSLSMGDAEHDYFIDILKKEPWKFKLEALIRKEEVHV